VLVSLVFLLAKGFEKQNEYYGKLFNVKNMDKLTEGMQSRIAKERKAETYKKQENYDLAIKEYKEILDTYGNEISEGPIREKLSSCYEKTKRYKEAIKQIDWLINANVVATPDLIARKQRIEKLTQE